MPENNNDNFNLPNLKKQPEPAPSNKPIIEIPQEYYDKLAKEKAEKEKMQQAAIVQQQNKDEFKRSSNKFIFNILLNAIAIFAILYLMTKYNKLIIIAMPLYFILYTFIKASKEKKECTASISVLIGGIVSAVVCFITAGFINENLRDYYDYYAVASVVSAFVGMFISNIITQIVANKENIKALQTLAYISFFVLLFGGSYVLYLKYPEQILRYVFMQKTEILAETEEEFIIKTLKNRYGVTFTCEKPKNHIDGQNQKFTTRTCVDPDNREINVTSTEYNQNEVLYTVQDEYIDIIFLNDVKASLAEKVKAVTDATNVTISIYPKEYCSFVGDCVDSDSYYENYQEENDRDKLFENSKKMDFTKYLDESAENFINDYGFGFQIAVYGNYSGLQTSNYEKVVESILEVMNTTGYQNKNGYEITLRNSDELKQIMYKVTGSKSDDGTFKDPKIAK